MLGIIQNLNSSHGQNTNTMSLCIRSPSSAKLVPLKVRNVFPGGKSWACVVENQGTLLIDCCNVRVTVLPFITLWSPQTFTNSLYNLLSTTAHFHRLKISNCTNVVLRPLLAGQKTFRSSNNVVSNVAGSSDVRGGDQPAPVPPGVPPQSSHDDTPRDPGAGHGHHDPDWRGDGAEHPHTRHLTWSPVHCMCGAQAGRSHSAN